LERHPGYLVCPSVFSGSDSSRTRRELPSRASSSPRSLRVESDAEVLVHVRDAAGISDPNEVPTPGAISKVIDPISVDEDVLISKLQDRIVGDGAPPWVRGYGGALRAGVNLCRVKDIYYATGFGAVIGDDGCVFSSTVQEALYATPSLSALPAVRAGTDGPVFVPPTDAPKLPSAAIFVAWGGLFNYGHFLLDCLSSLTVLVDRGLLGRFPAVSPLLTEWQRQLLQLLLSEDQSVTEFDAPIVYIRDAVFTSCMDHFLANPNRPLDSVRRRLLSTIDASLYDAERVYLTRSRIDKRLLVNEARLEEALKQRGFIIIAPETLSVAEQAALLSNADVVVAATGAGLANVLFMKPGAKVFEIQPSNFVNVWVRNLSHFFEVDWYCFVCPSPISETEVYAEGLVRPGVMFNWKLPLAEFLHFLDENL
jgi:capsular polysaccharide biosynthesis protein